MYRSEMDVGTDIIYLLMMYVLLQKYSKRLREEKKNVIKVGSDQNIKLQW